MGELLKEWFDLFCRKRWLKTIDKEVRKYNKLNDAARRSAHVAHKLMEKYNELYPDDKINREDRKLC